MAGLNGIKLRIDGSGRVVFPKKLRDRLGLRAGTELEVVDQQEGVMLRPVRTRPAMVKIEGLWVHQGAAEKGAAWDRLINDVREERIDTILRPRS